MGRPSLKALAAPALIALLALGLLGGPAAAAPAKKKPPGATWVAKIGWFYNDEPDFPQQKEHSVKIYWPVCVGGRGEDLLAVEPAHLRRLQR
ncbi:MAG: hypothetical protein J0H06_03715 [Actinobacteria bacterium]|nr:hypothetical protein [Actinomycetota bacterium]